jgi:glycosyltransferase involved in cell wall biosynthesis
VTAITVFHNRQDAVETSMRSLVDQDCPGGLHVIAVDDGSSDDTYEKLRAFASDRVEVRRQSNRGFTRTLVSLCAEIDSEFIALHGAGDESLPGRFMAQAAFLTDHPSVALVGCGIETFDELSGRQWPGMPDTDIALSAATGDYTISHGEAMFRREAYAQAGGYRSYFHVGQDRDLFMRLSRLGQIGYARALLYRRRLRADGVNASAILTGQRDILRALSMTFHAEAAKQVIPATQSLSDDLDRYGLLAPYFLPRSAAVAKGLSSAAVKYLIAGEQRLARRLASRSLSEKVTWRGLAVFVAMSAAIGPLAPIIIGAAAHLSSRRDESALHRLKR